MRMLRGGGPGAGRCADRGTDYRVTFKSFNEQYKTRADKLRLARRYRLLALGPSPHLQMVSEQDCLEPGAHEVAQ